jgi:membrane-bound serine protease (ClpP class)
MMIRTKRKGAGIVVAFLCSLFFSLAGQALSAGEAAVVVVAPMEGVVGVSLENFLDEAFSFAEKEKATLLVISIDTPGGLVTSMRGMSQKILAAPLPVAVWVGPPGARAASAGAFLVLAAHIAAMAPGTNIGAAHPVTASGQDVPDKEMSRKITNDLAAQIRSLAEERGRNAKVAADMVLESVSLTAREALDRGVIDTIAPDLPSLVKWMDGRKVKVGASQVILDLERYEIRRFEMSPRLRALHFISRPDVAYMMLTLGILAIVFEVLTPGGFVMGTSGAVMALIGAYGLRMLPFNWAGVILLVAGILVLVLDLVVGGVGILSLFGLASLAVGSLVIFRAPGGELLNVSVGFMAGMVVTLGIFFLFAAGAVWRSTRKKVTSGKEGMVLNEGVVVEDLTPGGVVNCHGEIWRAVSDDGYPIPKGTPVSVIRAEGLTLRVRASDTESLDLKGEGRQ